MELQVTDRSRPVPSTSLVPMILGTYMETTTQLGVSPRPQSSAAGGNSEPAVVTVVRSAVTRWVN
jgi:hypothetical protein